MADAARPHDERQTAFGCLFSSYWKPLYRYARRRGKSPEDAEDLLQGFFACLLQTEGLKHVDREKGRFRAFMLSAFKHYMIREWKRGKRQKRGGRIAHLSLDWRDAETGLSLEVEDGDSPDKLFDREWALALLAKVLDEMEREEKDFSKWKQFLSLDRQRIAYAEIARQYGISEGAARVSVHRLRRRYKDRVRQKIAGSLMRPELVDDEMRVLFTSLTDNFS